jgi:hypothetical protein
MAADMGENYGGKKKKKKKKSSKVSLKGLFAVQNDSLAAWGR